MCPLCGGQIRIIAFITYSADTRHISPARGPPLWNDIRLKRLKRQNRRTALIWGNATQLRSDCDHHLAKRRSVRHATHALARGAERTSVRDSLRYAIALFLAITVPVITILLMRAGLF